MADPGFVRMTAGTPTSPPARCAFEHCQAGGDILLGAPRVERQPYGPVMRQPYGPVIAYHPGCWAAGQRHDEWLRASP